MANVKLRYKGLNVSTFRWVANGKRWELSRVSADDVVSLEEGQVGYLKGKAPFVEVSGDPTADKEVTFEYVSAQTYKEEDVVRDEDGDGVADQNVEVAGQGYSTQPDVHEPTGTTLEIDWDDGNNQVIDLESASGDVTLTFVNPNAGACYFLKFVQGSTAREVILPDSVMVSNGGVADNTLIITTSEDAVDSLVLYYDGTNYLANFSQYYV
jgi:hypothetical protein